MLRHFHCTHLIRYIIHGPLLETVRQGIQGALALGLLLDRGRLPLVLALLGGPTLSARCLWWGWRVLQDLLHSRARHTHTHLDNETAWGSVGTYIYGETGLWVNL